MPPQMRPLLTLHFICWHHTCNWVPVLHFQSFCWPNEPPPPCRRREIRARVPVIPPLTLFFHVNVSVVLYPGHHLPFFRVRAPSTLDVSYCLRVSKQKVDMAFWSPKRSSIKSTSLLFMSWHVTWWGLLACPVCGNVGAVRRLFCCECRRLYPCQATVGLAIALRSDENSDHANPPKLKWQIQIKMSIVKHLIHVISVFFFPTVGFAMCILLAKLYLMQDEGNEG